METSKAGAGKVSLSLVKFKLEVRYWPKSANIFLRTLSVQLCRVVIDKFFNVDFVSICV